MGSGLSCDVVQLYLLLITGEACSPSLRLLIHHSIKAQASARVRHERTVLQSTGTRSSCLVTCD
jgi:hypothetical protein